MPRTTRDSAAAVRASYCVIVAILYLLGSSPAFAAPRVSAHWQGRAVVVTWSGLPYGTCVRLEGVTLSDTCRPAGTLTLPLTGIDAAYAPKGGDWLLVVDPITPAGHPARVLASAEIPMVEVRLPIVAR